MKESSAFDELLRQIIGGEVLSREEQDRVLRSLKLVERDACLQKVEDTEPMFVLLARDSTAPEVMLEWCRLRTKEIRQGTRPNTAEEREHVTVVMKKITEFTVWHLVNRTLAQPLPDSEE